MSRNITETDWCNGFWRHFEKYSPDGELVGEATVSKSSGEMHIRKLRLGLVWTEKVSRCDPDNIPSSVAIALC